MIIIDKLCYRSKIKICRGGEQSYVILFFSFFFWVLPAPIGGVLENVFRK